MGQAPATTGADVAACQASVDITRPCLSLSIGDYVGLHVSDAQETLTDAVTTSATPGASQLWSKESDPGFLAPGPANLAIIAMGLIGTGLVANRRRRAPQRHRNSHRHA